MSAGRTLTTQDIADRYGISEYQVKDRCRRGEWPHLRVGRLVRFTEAHVEQIDRILEKPVAQHVKAARSWGRKTRGGAA